MEWPLISYAVADVITIVIVDRWYMYTCGRCYCQHVLYCGRWQSTKPDIMASFAEQWQMLWPCGRWNSHFQGGFHFSLSSEMLSRTSSHMYLFLFPISINRRSRTMNPNQNFDKLFDCLKIELETFFFFPCKIFSSFRN